MFGLTIVLCLHGAINANVVDENFQIVYPQQLRKAKVLEDLPLDGSFEVEMRVSKFIFFQPTGKRELDGYFCFYFGMV